MTGQEQLTVALERVLEKILDAAKDGQGGSNSYKLDRLRLIQQYAEIGLKRATPNGQLEETRGK